MTGWGSKVFAQRSRRWVEEARWRPWGMLGKAETCIQRTGNQSQKVQEKKHSEESQGN